MSHLNVCVMGVDGVGGYFGGTIIDLGKKLGISTPTTQKIYRELKEGSFPQ